MKVTLQDVAREVGVTPSTVQRALNNANGVGPARREEIKRVAAKMGYRLNYHASSLKRGAKRIAVILPDLNELNRYFAYYIWQGINLYMEEVSLLNIELVRLPYSDSPKGQRQILENLLNHQYGDIDGIITRVTMDDALDAAFNQLQEANLPVVLVGTDLVSKNRICCVKNYEEMQGRMAADLLTNFGAIDGHKKIIICGNFAGSDQYHNAKGFERRVWQSKLPVDIHKIAYDQDPKAIIDVMARELQSNVPVYAIYTCSTRSTIAMCKAVQQTGMAGRVQTIGSDIFQESAQYMRQGVLKAIIHSRPATMSYQAAQVMAMYLTHGELPQGDTIFIDPCIVLPGSLEFYIDTLPNFAQEEAVRSIG